MDDCPPIEDHGLIGDLQTAALVTTDATVDWFCCPRFDSPSVFGALLDRNKGGHFTVWPAADTYTTKQLYHPDTAVLVTRFMTGAGAGEVVDFMPVTGTAATDRHRLVRMLRCVRGSMTFQGEIAPRFDYGRKPHEAHVTAQGALFTSQDLDLAVHAVRAPRGLHPPGAHRRGDHPGLDAPGGPARGVDRRGGGAKTPSPRDGTGPGRDTRRRAAAGRSPRPRRRRERRAGGGSPAGGETGEQGHAAVDVQGGSHHVVHEVGGEGDDGVGDVLGVPDPVVTG